MAKKFYDIDEAATVIGVSAAQLNDMRTRNEIRGFRDGATWKFRAEEVEKVAADLKGKPASHDDDDDIQLAADPTSEEGEGGSVLLSERELGSAPTTSSTIIGKSSRSSESDIRLADGPRDKGGSDVKLAEHSDVLRSGSTSGITGGSSAGNRETGSDLGLQFEELDSLELDFEDAGPSKSGVGSGKSGSGSGKNVEKKLAPPSASDSTLQLAEDDAVGGSGSRKATGSNLDGSALDLSGDDDLVLGGSGSDVTTKPGDSGISLMDPSDSGLSLDEPLDLSGSQIDGGSLVLGEDDMITLGGSNVDVSGATQLRSDDDFLLTPTTKAGDESESGSQVIALDSIEGFDEDAATQVGGAAAMRMLEEDISGADTMVGGAGMVPAGAMAGAPGMMMVPAVPEAPYSIWNVLAMFVCIAILCLVGMMMADLVRNMWNWEHGTYTVNSGLMDSLIEMFFKK